MRDGYVVKRVMSEMVQQCHDLAAQEHRANQGSLKQKSVAIPRRLYSLASDSLCRLSPQPEIDRRTETCERGTATQDCRRARMPREESTRDEPCTDGIVDVVLGSVLHECQP